MGGAGPLGEESGKLGTGIPEISEVYIIVRLAEYHNPRTGRFIMFGRRCLLVIAVLLLGGSQAGADEGMWPLYDLDKLPFQKLKALGLELDQDDIYNPEGTGIANAVVGIGGGTGSFVSPNGLIITNHHVAFGAVQRKSTVEHNYIRDGFYAGTEEEIPAIGYSVYVTLSVEDVTDRVLARVDDDMGDLERFKAIDAARKEIVKECEEGRDVKCYVASMFGGAQYVLYTEFKIRDIRIVYAPPAAIGQYGGEIDNWMWPRHTGDYSFLRAYVAPDGSSAEYSEENVPYHPKVYLLISSAGVREDDFAIVIGFPGGTDRYASSFSVDRLINHRYPVIIEMVEDILDILGEASAADSSTAIRVAAKVEGLSNVLKNSYGMLEGFEKGDLLETKRETEEELTAFLDENRKLKKKYGTVLAELEDLYREMMRYEKKDFILRVMPFACDLLNLSVTTYRWAAEREKDDMERDRGFQDRDSTSVRERLEHAQINLVPSVDREALKYFIGRALDLPADQKIEGLEKIFSGKEGRDRSAAIDEYLDTLFGETRVGDLEERMAMFKLSVAELEALGDPFIDLAAVLKPENDESLERSKTFRGGLAKLEPRLIAAYAEWKGGDLYPDANGTKRFSYGTVKGYRPRDAVRYDYLSTLKGLMEKETGEEPFVVPPLLKQAWERRRYSRYADAVYGDVPVDFLTTNDSTGGNSGSPVLNGRGEIVGLLFDGNYESIAADFLFMPELTRSINVDIRYVLFTIDEVYDLDGLMRELTIH